MEIIETLHVLCSASLRLNSGKRSLKSKLNIWSANDNYVRESFFKIFSELDA